MGYGQIEDKPFNMSEAFLMTLIELRKTISNFAVNGEHFAWYRGCMDFWNMIFFELEEEENKNVQDLLDKIKALLNNPPTKDGQALMRAKISQIEDKLNEVTRVLFVFLNNHERIFMKSKFKTWHDEIKQDFS